MLDLILENQLILVALAAAVLPMVLSVFMVLLTVLVQRHQARMEAKRQAQLLAMKREKKRIKRMQALELEAAAAEAAANTPVEAQPEQSEDEEQADSAIQDILTSVFADEEGNTYYDLLLEDKQPMHIGELQQFAEQVSAALRAQLGGLAS